MPFLKLSNVFCLTLRDVDLILAERGVMVAHESIRRWCLRFSQELCIQAAPAKAEPG